MNASDITPSSRAAPARRDGVWLALGAVALLGLGGAFWFANGQRAFGEFMLGAFSWCF